MPGARRLALLLFLLPLAPSAQAQTSPSSADALVAELRSDDQAVRTAALERLEALGDAARPALRRALRDSDPEVRFYALQLLNRSGGKLVRELREVLEQAAATGDGSAIRTFEGLIQAGTPETPSRLVQVVRRELQAAGRGKPLMAVLALDLLRELLPKRPSAQHAAQLATLLELDPGAAFHALTMAFGALPFEHALPALRSVINGGSDPAQIRAALVLGEITPSGQAKQGAAALVPLLKANAAAVRLAGLQALDLLDLQQAQALLPAAKLVTDPNPAVAGEALRIAGERKLPVARNHCETLVQDPKLPMSLRKQAARTLGLLGNPSAGAVLKGLTGPRVPRELRILSAWALGAARSPQALPVLLPMIQSTALSQEQALFCGLARAGARQQLFDLIRMPTPMPAGRDEVILLRGRAARALRASHLLADVRTARDLSELATQARALRTDQPGPTVTEIRLAIEALAARGDDESRYLLGGVLIDEDAARDRQIREACLEALSKVGMPDGDDALKGRVVAELVREVRRGRRLRTVAADALARVDPATARSTLRAQRFGNSRSLRELARSLARAGDPSLIARYALPFSKSAVKSATPGRRVDMLNNVGIDLLYARDYRQALLIFRRMTWSKPDHDLAAYNAACAFALDGKVEPALRCLRQAVFRLGYKNASHMAADTDLTLLRKDRRFQRLLRQLRLADETQMPIPELKLPTSR